MTEEMVSVPKLSAQVLFDALVHSMDFGSGFLDTEEVQALRVMARVLGVDPASATPEEFVKHFPHAFKPMSGIQISRHFHDAIRTVGSARAIAYVPCGAGTSYSPCAKQEGDQIHHLEAADG